MNRIKKLFLIFIFFILFCSIAKSEDFTIGNLKYSISWDNTSVTVSKADNASLTGELIIPETVQNGGVTYSVKYIGWNGFGNTDITAVKLPNSITELNAFCFDGCSKLEKINLPQNITYLGYGLFNGCNSLTSIESHIYYPFDIINNTPFNENVFLNTVLIVPTGSINRYRTSMGWKDFSSIIEIEMDDVDKNILKYTILDSNNVSVAANSQQIDGDIVIPNEVVIDGKTYTVKQIESSGFEHCSKITTISLPSTIKVIDWWAFAYTNIKNIELPENLEDIGSWAFHGCSKLEKITIPKNVNSFGWGVFSGDCNSLKEITVAEGNTNFKADNGMLLSKDGRIMAAYAFGRSEEHLIIPETVTSLNVCALFKGNKRLKNITVSSGVKYIGGDTFNGCTALTNVYLPDSISEMEYSAFSNCTSLKTIIIPASLSKVSNSAFYGCASVDSVVVRQNTPIEIAADLFDENVYQNATLYIPIGRSKIYKDAVGWSKFNRIKEIEMDGIVSSESPYDNVEDNQMILGYYSSNECQAAGGDGYGGPQGGLYKVCIGFSKDQITPFAGNQIKNVRFGLVHTDDMSGVQLWIGSSRDKKDLYTQNISNLQSGWNEIELTTPYTITEDSIFVGIEYKTQYSNYPISCVSTGKEKGSSYFYGPYNNGKYSWLDTGESQSLSLQCLIEGENLPLNFMRSLPPVVNSLYQKSGETISGNVSLKNWGKKNVEDYDIKYQIDGNDVEFTQWSKPSIGRNDYTSLYFELKVPQTLEAGQHRLTAVITQVNGMPSQYYPEGSQPTSLKVYTKSYERKKVIIDHLTAQWCPNSVRVDKEIEMIMSQHNDIILLTSNLQDNLSCDASEAFGIFSEYIPAIYYDRYSSAGATSLGYAGYETAKKQPSLVTIDVSATYIDSDNKIHIKVQGERNEEFAAVEGDANLTVLITEDKIDAPQSDYETGGYDHYEHNGVIRGNVSAIWGDPIQWDGNNYDMDFTMPYNSKWNLENLHVVVFIARPYNGNLGNIHILNSDETNVGLPEKLVIKSYHGFLGDIAITDRCEAKGITADGASQLIIYSDKDDSEIVNSSVTFEINGQMANDPERVGTVSGIQKLDNGKWGFVYTAPNIFPEDNEDNRFNLRINIIRQDGMLIRGVDIDVYRPGVLFLHGLFSNRGCFKDLVKWITSSKTYSEEQVLNATYWMSNAASFEDNTYKVNVVGNWLKNLYFQLLDKKIVSTRYDLIGHSMGGILSRKYAQEINPAHINRIITLDTPHSGSQLADLGKKVAETIDMTIKIMDAFLVLKMIPVVEKAKSGLEVIHAIYENCPALNDLAVKSDAIALLNGENLQNAIGIPVHAICSYMLNPEMPVFETNSISQPALTYCSAIETDEFFISEEKHPIGKSALDALYEEEFHDGVVSKTSQEGGLDKQHVTYETDVYDGMLGLKSNAHHTKTNNWHVTYNNILNLLRKPKTADCFSANGFKPVDLSPIKPSQIRHKVPVQIPDYSNLPDSTFFKLYLAREDNDSIIDIRVRNSENIVNNLVFMIIGDDQIIMSTGRTDYRFLIPDTCKGKIVIYALGKTDEGFIVGDTTFIHYHSDVKLNSIKFKSEEELTLKLSETRQLDVVGIWDNGEESLIIPTFTTDNDNVISISNDTITALSEGECQLYVSYAGLSEKLKIIVKNPHVLHSDVNSDGVVNGTDIQAIINFIVAGEYDENADVNKDNVVNGTDIQEVINIIVNAE